MVQRLAVIGAGPKGAAIAAKAAALHTVSYSGPIPEIDLYDPNPVGAAWRGSYGYTDGVQRLCTLAERDLGFPYDALHYGAHGADVAKAMLADFSWQSFAVNLEGSSSYRDWVVNGRRPPRHSEFAAYLEYAVGKAVAYGAARLIEKAVSAVDFDYSAGKWRVDSSDSTGVTTFERYDGVVITGSGRPYRAMDGANNRVFDALSFWEPATTLRMQHLLAVDGEDASVVIIGAGGTGAAIAHYFARRKLTLLPIFIVGREATFFARHHGPFEDRLFTDEDAWGALAPHVRAAFLARTTAGVVWDDVLRNLVSDNINYVSNSAVGFLNKGAGYPGEPDVLDLKMAPPPNPALRTPAGTPPPPAPITPLPGSVFIDARGFDQWGFAGKFFTAPPLYDFFAPPPSPGEPSNRDIIPSAIDLYLSVQGTLASSAPFPDGLHIPSLGGLQGPAAANLMALGWLADRILSRYCF
jgi:mycobactin lysine-N-oxygenase